MKNKTFHDYFSNLAIFSGHDWIKIGVLKIRIIENHYLLKADGTQDNDNKYISFCYMLSRMEGDKEKATNYNDAYVDFNVIPNGATSALVIERSLFGEYMVMPSIHKLFRTEAYSFEAGTLVTESTKLGDLYETYKSKTKTESVDSYFKKYSKYSFVSQGDKALYLYSFLDYISQLKIPQNGKISANKFFITFEEDKLRITFTEVEYDYGLVSDSYEKAITAKISKEYIVSLKINESITDATSLPISSVVDEVYFNVTPIFSNKKEVTFGKAFNESFNKSFLLLKVSQELLLPLVMRSVYFATLAKSNPSIRNDNQGQIILNEIKGSQLNRVHKPDSIFDHFKKVFSHNYEELVASHFINLIPFIEKHHKFKTDSAISEPAKLIEKGIEDSLKSLSEFITDETKDDSIIDKLLNKKGFKKNNTILKLIKVNLGFNHILYYEYETNSAKNELTVTFNESVGEVMCNLRNTINSDQEYCGQRVLKLNLEKGMLNNYIVRHTIKSLVKNNVTEAIFIDNENQKNREDKVRLFQQIKKLSENDEELKQEIQKLKDPEPKFGDFWYKTNVYEKAQFLLPTIVSYFADHTLNALAYQASVSESNEQFSLQTTVSESRTNDADYKDKDGYLKKEIQKIINSMDLPSNPSEHTKHTIDLNGAFLIAYKKQ